MSLECSICFFEYNESLRTPSIMSCGHTFCKKCIEQLQTPNQRSKKCPSCKKICLVEQIQTNYALQNLIEDLKKQKLEKEMVKIQKQKKKEIKKQNKCQQHNKKFESFCFDDDCSLCLYCLMLEHKNHNVMHLNDAIEQIKGNQFQVAQKFQSLYSKQIEEMIDIYHEKAQHLFLSKQSVENNINEDMKQLQQLLCEYKEKQIKQINVQYQSEWRKLQSKIKELKNKSEEIIQISVDQENFQSYKDYVEKINKLKINCFQNLEFSAFKYNSDQKNQFMKQLGCLFHFEFQEIKEQKKQSFQKLKETKTELEKKCKNMAKSNKLLSISAQMQNQNLSFVQELSGFHTSRDSHFEKHCDNVQQRIKSNLVLNHPQTCKSGSIENSKYLSQQQQFNLSQKENRKFKITQNNMYSRRHQRIQAPKFNNNMIFQTLKDSRNTQQNQNRVQNQATNTLTLNERNRQNVNQ